MVNGSIHEQGEAQYTRRLIIDISSEGGDVSKLIGKLVIYYTLKGKKEKKKEED